MKTADLGMTKAQATQELEKYEGADTVQDRLIARAYRAIKRGKRVLDLFDSMRLAGCDDLGRPKLAIARADWVACELKYWTHDATVDFREALRWGRAKKAITLPASCLPGLVAPKNALQAVIPLIPPKYRPETPKLFHILWEADWKDVPIDPLLLKHVGGSLYIVLAAWDLTAVERAVLRGTR